MDSSLRTTNPQITGSGGATHNTAKHTVLHVIVSNQYLQCKTCNMTHYNANVSTYKHKNAFLLQHIASAILEQHNLTISSRVGGGEGVHRILIMILPELASLRHSQMIILSVSLRQCSGVVVTNLVYRP